MSVAEHYPRARALFGERVREVSDEQWELATPCPDWNVRSLVAHVVLGEAMIPPLFGGEQVAASSEIDPSILGPDAMSVWRGTALAAMEAANAVGLDTIVAHPVGDVPVSTVLGFRIVDNLVHGWDLATAIGVGSELPEDLAEWSLDFLFPFAGMLGDGAFFGPIVEPPAEAAAEVRLLGLVGRQVPAS